MQIISSDATIADLEQKAAECECAAEVQPEPAATDLKKLADLCREWAVVLQSGRWIP